MSPKLANAIASFVAPDPIGADDPEKDRDKKPKRMDRAPSGLSTDMLKGLGGSRGLEEPISLDDR